MVVAVAKATSGAETLAVRRRRPTPCLISFVW